MLPEPSQFHQFHPCSQSLNMTELARGVGIIHAELTLVLVDCEIEMMLAVLEVMGSELAGDSSTGRELYH